MEEELFFNVFVWSICYKKRIQKADRSKGKKKENSQILSSRTLLNWREILGKSKYIIFFFLTLSCIPCSQVGEDLTSIHIKWATNQPTPKSGSKSLKNSNCFFWGNCQWQRRGQSDTVLKMSMPSCFCALCYVTLPLLLHPEVPLCFLMWDLMMWLALVNEILRDMTQAEVWNMCVQCIFLMCL